MGRKVFIAILILGFLVWVHTRGFVVGDEGYLLNAGARMMDGQWPYRDFQFVYQPLTAYLNFLAFKFWGVSILSSRVMAILVSGLGVVAIFKIFGQTKWGIAVVVSYLLWGPGQINFLAPTMICLALGLWHVWGLKNGKWMLVGVTAGLVILTKQNFGLAILLLDLFYIKRFVTGYFYGLLGIILAHSVILFLTGSMIMYLVELYETTVVKIGLKGIFTTAWPWEYPQPLIIKLVKTAIYAVPAILAVKELRNDKVLALLVLAFYGLSIRPTTDWIHLTPLLAISGLLISGKYRTWFMAGWIAAGVLVLGYGGYYKWGKPIVEQTVVWKIGLEVPELASEKYVFIYSYSPGWYVVLGKQNPTPYDYLHSGILDTKIERRVIGELLVNKVQYVLADGQLEADRSRIAEFVVANYSKVAVVENLTLWKSNSVLYALETGTNSR